MKIRIRTASDPRHPLVYDSWLRYWAGSGLGRRRAEGGRACIDRILTCPSTELRLAVDPDDEERILGLAVTSGEVLHWIYVKHEARGWGVSAALLEGRARWQVWHVGRGVERIARGATLEFDPLLLLRF